MAQTLRAVPVRFVHSTITNPTLNDDNKRVVRSNAMRSFRRRQRYGEASELEEINTASNLAYRKHRESRLRKQREAGRQQKPSTINEPNRNSSHQSARCVASSEENNSNVPSSGGILTLHSPVVFQCSISSAFFNGTISRRERDLPTIKHCIEHWLNPRSKALEAAFKAVVLFEFGSTTNNRSASVEGLKWHLRALQRLRLDLQNPKADNQALRGTAQMLLFCGNYQLAKQAGGSRGKQIEGLTTLHTLARVDSKVNDPFEQSLFRTLRLVALMNGLVSRKSLNVQLFGGRYCQQGRSEDLVQTALFLPSILEETDKILARKKPGTQGLYKLILRASVLDSDLQRFQIHHTSFHHDTECSLMPFHRMDIETDDVYLCDKFEEAFGGRIEFDSFLCANLHCFYWICLLLLRQCMRSLLEALSLSRTGRAGQNSKSTFEMAMEKTIESLARRDLSAEINECADSLCRTVPYLLSCTDGSCSMAMAVAAPLNFALDLYARTLQEGKTAWCLEMVQKIQQAVPYLDWDTLIVWQIYAVLWLAQ